MIQTQTQTQTRTSNHLARATIIIAIFSLLAKILGLARNTVLTHTFGAGDSLDVYFAAFRIPDFLYNLLILGTLSAAFIPVFSGYLVHDKKNAWRLANSIFNFTLLAMAALSVIVAIFARPLVSLIVPGFGPEKQALTAQLTRIMMFSPLLFSLSSVFSSVLNSFKKFAAVAAAPLFYNLSVIFGVVVFYPKFGMSGLAFGVVLGAALHFLSQWPAIRQVGFRWQAVLDTSDRGFLQVVKLFIPRIFSMDGGQIALLVTAVIGSTLKPGSIAVYSLANDLQAIPLGIIAVSFAIAAFPYLSEAAAQNDRENFRQVFNDTLSQILFIIIPFSALMIVLRAQIVRLVYGTGSFNWDDTVATLTALGVFCLSLFAQSLVPLLARAFYSLHNTVIPVVSGVVAIVVNVIAAEYFIGLFSDNLKVAGLALAFSLSAIVNFLILFIWLEIKFGNLIDRFLILKMEKILTATLASGIAAYAALYAIAPFVDNRTYLGLFVQAFLAGAAGVIAYLGAGALLNLGEARHILTWSKSWLSKLRTAFGWWPGGV